MLACTVPAPARPATRLLAAAAAAAVVEVPPQRWHRSQPDQPAAPRISTRNTSPTLLCVWNTPSQVWTEVDRAGGGEGEGGGPDQGTVLHTAAPLSRQSAEKAVQRCRGGRGPMRRRGGREPGGPAARSQSDRSIGMLDSSSTATGGK